MKGKEMHTITITTYNKDQTDILDMDVRTDQTDDQMTNITDQFSTLYGPEIAYKAIANGRGDISTWNAGNRVIEVLIWD